MDQDRWKLVDEGIDQLAENLEQLLDSAATADLKKLLGNLQVKLGKRFGISLTCSVELSDRDADLQREHVLRLLNTGIATCENGELYRTWGDSTPHRYVVDGEIHVVPHDQCPKCWGDWDFKWTHRSCSHCDAALGKNCKILLDSDICPHCEEGKVTAREPQCERCGFAVDLSCVAWG
jgi:hypothetical protein